MSVELSIVLPAYNEEAVLPATLKDVAAAVGPLVRSWELVCVDDGSTDSTAAVLAQAAAKDSRIRPVYLSRNFGKEGAMCAGIAAASGEGVLLMDADLQHPVSVISTMLEKWRAGYDIVEGVKANRGQENWMKGALAKGFYVLFQQATGVDLRNSSDFQLLDRQVVDVLVSLPEQSRFFRGLSRWVGFKRAEVPFEVANRAAGTTGWSTGELARYAISNILSFSTLPLHFTTLLGFFSVVFALTLTAQTLWQFFAGGAIDGFATVIIATSFFSGTILLALGILASYIARALDEIRSRPAYIVRQVRSEPQSAEVPATEGAEDPS